MLNPEKSFQTTFKSTFAAYIIRTIFPGNMMQIDLVGPFQSPFYKYVLSGIDVSSKYLFAIPLTSAHAGTKAKALVFIFFQHSYIPTTILSDLGTSFVANCCTNSLTY